MSVDNWLGIDIHNCEFFRELRIDFYLGAW